MISVPRADKPWTVGRPLEKLNARARLPGAFTFDQAAHALRKAALGVEEQLSLAFPASWLVNSPAASKTFRAWLTPPLRDAWCELVAFVAEGPDAWLASAAAERADVQTIVDRLAAEQGGLEALSKALALLAPQAVPLMPPLAVSFALGGEGSAASAFTPMMDWFANATLANEAELIDVARAYTIAPLDGTQVLDRLLWFESDGHKHFPELPAGGG